VVMVPPPRRQFSSIGVLHNAERHLRSLRCAEHRDILTIERLPRQLLQGVDLYPHLAYEHPNLDVIRALVAVGTDVNGRDSFGQAPPYVAVSSDINSVAQTRAAVRDDAIVAIIGSRTERARQSGLDAPRPGCPARDGPSYLCVGAVRSPNRLLRLTPAN
jgi:hypothetical protein